MILPRRIARIRVCGSVLGRPLSWFDGGCPLFRHHLVRVVLFAVLVGAFAEPASAQPLAVNSKAYEAFKDARDLLQRGKYDLAADQLKAFLAAGPTDADLFLIQSKLGNNSFLQLRNVLRWNDNETADKEARATVEEIIKKADAATKAVGRDPVRIQGHVRNLVGSREERMFAQMQLKQSGDAATPVMVELLRSTNDPPLRAAILSIIPLLGAETVPGFLAAIEGLPNDVKPALLEALSNRSDILALISYAETDFTPYLWYYAGLPLETPSTVRTTSAALLNALTGGASAKKKSEAELTRLAQPFVSHTANFRSIDKIANKVKVSAWDKDKLVVKVEEVTPAQAEEYYGLKYLRWAIERNAAYEPAQLAFVSLATERAVERAKFGDLSKSEPSVYQLLSAAPASLLTNLLQNALAEKRTALSIGLLQAIGDRAQKEPLSTTGKNRPSPAVQALSYPDPRVQFAGALALLRSPGPPTHGQTSKIVEILKRALGADLAAANQNKVGRAIIADPSGQRGELLTATFRDAGYAAERVGSGRELLRRLAKSSDYDLIAIDRHILDPQLNDLLAQLSADTNAARRPILVVASTDVAKPVPFEHLLLRLAMLIAAAETEEIKVPEPYVRDPNRPLDDPAKLKRETIQTRDIKIQDLAAYRIKRMKRLVDAADIPTSVDLAARLDLRISQFTYAILAAEYDATVTSAPRTAGLVKSSTAVVQNRKELDFASNVKTTANLIHLMEQLESTLNEAQKKKFEEFRIRVQPDTLGMEFDTSRDLGLEAALEKQVRVFPGVRVIAEPFTAFNLKFDIQAAVPDAAAMPRDASEKKASAKLAAEWLRKLALDEIPGYDVKPAEGELRKALADDELAPDSAEALARIGSGDAQQALVNLAVQPTRPVPVRLKAIDAAIRHIQGFGKLTGEVLANQVTQVAETETDAPLKAKLGVLARLVAAKPPEFGTVIQQYPVKLPQAPPKPAPPMEPKEPKN